MNDEPFINALKALAHPIRFRILQTLSSGEHNVGEIEDTSKIGQPALSQQLAVLRNAGLVITRKEAKLVYYRIDGGSMDRIAALVGGLGGGSAETTPKKQNAARGVANFARMS